jgi:RND superfamily putative drug exporter
MFDSLASLANRHAKGVVIGVVLATLFAGAFGARGLSDRLLSFAADDPATDSVKATERIAESTGLSANPGLVVLVRTDGPAISDAGKEKVDEVVRVVRADSATGAVVTAWSRGVDRDSLVSEDGRATYVAATFKDGEGEDAAERLGPKLDEIDGVTPGGFEVANLEVNEIVGKDLARAELLAFPLLFLLSLWFFRSVVAALLPLMVGGVSIVLTMLGLRIASGPFEISVFALNLVTGLGLGLAIDYSLFIVSRYREEIAEHGAGAEALRRTMNTAGRTVLFSGLTVAAALASLLVFPQRFLYSMGIGGLIVALVAVTISLVLLPAVLSLLGERVNSLAPAWLKRASAADARPASSGFWYRLSRFVMRRPGRIALASGLLMIVLGLPFLRVDFTAVDATVLPSGNPARVVSEALSSEFPAGRTTPVVVVASTGDQGELRAFSDELRSLPGAAAVQEPRPVGDGLARIDVVSRGGEIDDTSQELVRDIRGLSPGFDTLVGGSAAEFVDQKSSLAEHIPYALAIVAIATIVVLFLMTGSVILPIKAVIMNLLTLSATFGLLVLIFQDGRFESILDFSSQGALESSQPIFLFAVAFGLSTDYGVFLLARIKEARDHGASDTEAVAVGLERTGRIVTAAALLFSVAIGAFATSQIVFIKELGIGTALAVLIDATIVRALLVPSLMELLGKWNWWAPAPLRRLHERFGLSESEPAAQPG